MFKHCNKLSHKLKYDSRIYQYVYDNILNCKHCGEFINIKKYVSQSDIEIYGIKEINKWVIGFDQIEHCDDCLELIDRRDKIKKIKERI